MSRRPTHNHFTSWLTLAPKKKISGARLISSKTQPSANRAATLEEPLRQIANNSGEEGSVVVIKVKELEQDFGFNAQEEKYQDLVKAGIIDPTKVVRTALQNAASIAGLMLTTEALVSEIPEEKKAAPGMGGEMAGMGGF